jgi:hypothetical protein
MCVVAGLFLAMMGSLIFMAMRASEKNGQLTSENEGLKHEVDVQEKFVEIASRPSADADSLLRRMHEPPKSV